MRGASAIVGIGESTYYRPGGSPDSDRQPRFERFKAAADRYATYESQTDREIPVVALREVPA